ncbi:MAG: hypothetical protein RR565_11100, partial [Erysipelothrix sp.]
ISLGINFTISRGMKNLEKVANKGTGTTPIYDELDNQLEGINAKVNKLESSDNMNEFWASKGYT